MFVPMAIVLSVISDTIFADWNRFSYSYPSSIKHTLLLVELWIGEGVFAV